MCFFIYKKFTLNIRRDQISGLSLYLMDLLECYFYFFSHLFKSGSVSASHHSLLSVSDVRPVSAGPFSSLPLISNRDPWQGQSQDTSEGFHLTVQPV